VNGVELVKLEEAADAFGVSHETLKNHLSSGTLPEAINEDGRWKLPAAKLHSIASREGWPLDLTGKRPARAEMPEQLDRYISETMAAHAAVVLAKTQATAAQAEAQSSARKLKAAQHDLDAEMAERQRTVEELLRAQQQVSKLDKDLAVSCARSEELRRQLDHERAEHGRLYEKIDAIERQRDELHAAIGWAGRRRLRRLERPSSSRLRSGAITTIETQDRR